MSAEFATLQLWIADSLGSPGFGSAASNEKFENDAQIELDYCIPKQFVKKRTDVTGVQNEQDVHPDTGPAGALVEVQFTVDRSIAQVQDFLTALIRMYGTQLTDSDFRRGRIGLTTRCPTLCYPVDCRGLVYYFSSYQEN